MGRIGKKKAGATTGPQTKTAAAEVGGLKRLESRLQMTLTLAEMRGSLRTTLNLCVRPYKSFAVAQILWENQLTS